MKKLIISTLVLLVSSNIFASTLRDIEWKKISEKDGITVYSPVNYEHESGLVPIRFKAVLDHDVLKVLSALADNERKKEWLPNAKEVKEFDKKSMSDLTVYYRYNAPWPFHDRDFIVHNLGKFDPDKQIINVDIHSVDHKADPKDGNTVRGKTYDGYSIIKPNGKSQTELEIAFLNDFGGNIPNFVVNFVTQKWPYKFMKQLNSHLSKNEIKIFPEFQRRAKAHEKYRAGKKRLN